MSSFRTSSTPKKKGSALVLGWQSFDRLPGFVLIELSFVQVF